MKVSWDYSQLDGKIKAMFQTTNQINWYSEQCNPKWTIQTTIRSQPILLTRSLTKIPRHNWTTRAQPISPGVLSRLAHHFIHVHHSIHVSTCFHFFCGNHFMMVSLFHFFRTSLMFTGFSQEDLQESHGVSTSKPGSFHLHGPFWHRLPGR